MLIYFAPFSDAENKESRRLAGRHSRWYASRDAPGSRWQGYRLQRLLETFQAFRHRYGRVCHQCYLTLGTSRCEVLQESAVWISG